MDTPIANDCKREDILRNLAQARTQDRAREIAKAAHDAGLITNIDLMRALSAARKLPTKQAAKRWNIGEASGDEWTADEDELLAELVKRGDTFAEIAAHYVDRTRDACLGRAYRLGLQHPNGEMK